jgi:hypothetical protein
MAASSHLIDIAAVFIGSTFWLTVAGAACYRAFAAARGVVAEIRASLPQKVVAPAPSARAAASPTAAAAKIEAALQRFPETVRAAVVAAAQEHPRLADLALSCPAALVALAATGETASERAALRLGRALTIEGRPLAEICAALGVPLWLRRARPETFVAPPRGLPDTPQARRLIAPYVPCGDAPIETQAQSPSRWLGFVVLAFETADEAVGLWVARCAARTPEQVWDHDARLVCLWAWFASRPDAEEPRWSAQLSWERARTLAVQWRERVEFDIFGGPPEWALTEAEVEGFVFKPLATQGAIVEEGQAMGHCVASYARDVASGECALWGVRRGEERVATLEVGASCGGDFMTVRQLFGPENEAAPREAWRAATLFTLARAEDALGSAPVRASEAERREGWERLFEPYWKAKGGTRAWAPLTPQGVGLGL